MIIWSKKKKKMPYDYTSLIGCVKLDWAAGMQIINWL